MPSDPIADRRWIGCGDNPGGLLRFGRVLPAIDVHDPRCMEAKDCPAGDTDSALRKGDQDQRAGGKTGAVNDNSLPGLPQRLKQPEKRNRVTAGARFYPHVGHSEIQGAKQYQDTIKKSPHRT
jgi:hypothetical protein